MASPVDEASFDGLDALADLSEHIWRAQRAIESMPFGGDDDKPASDEGPDFLEVFAVARAAVDSLNAFVNGQRFPASGEPRIVLVRTNRGVTVIVDSSLRGAARRRGIAAFIAEVRRADARLLSCAELLGLLLGLCTKWAAAGFAPPAVLLSLRESAPQILELGRHLAKANR